MWSAVLWPPTVSQGLHLASNSGWVDIAATVNFQNLSQRKIDLWPLGWQMCMVTIVLSVAERCIRKKPGHDSAQFSDRLVTKIRPSLVMFHLLFVGILLSADPNPMSLIFSCPSCHVRHSLWLKGRPCWFFFFLSCTLTFISINHLYTFCFGLCCHGYLFWTFLHAIVALFLSPFTELNNQF